MGKEAETPEAPDYSALARQQSALSQQAADRQTRTNRPNLYSPMGSETWVNEQTTARQLDADAYAAALDAYSKQQKPQTIRNPNWTVDSDEQMYITPEVGNLQAPNKEDFYRDMPMDNWSRTTSMSPQNQAMYDRTQQMQTQLLDRLMSNLGSGGQGGGTAMGGRSGSIISPTQALSNYLRRTGGI